MVLSKSNAIKKVKKNIEKRKSYYKSWSLLMDISYNINNIKLRLGYSPLYNFEPFLWIHDGSHRVGFNASSWTKLHMNKNIVSLKLDGTMKNRESLNVLKEKKFNYEFKWRNSTAEVCLTIQHKISKVEKIELCNKEWAGLCRISPFISQFLCSSLARNAIREFYYNVYIPTCIKLGKMELELKDAQFKQYDEIEMVDYMRLCIEIPTAMKKKLKTDIENYSIIC